MFPRRFILFISILILGFGGAPLASHAAPASDPAAFLSTLVDKGIQLMKDKQLPTAQRDQQFSTLLEQGFDIPRIARFVLGRYWTTASEQDRQDFNKYFEAWIVRTYSARFREYGGETVKVTGTQPVNADTTIVKSQITRPSGPPTKVDWRVRKNQNDYKIVDVEVEGVSMAVTQRDEFASVIQQNGGTVAGLNKALEQKLASDRPDAPAR
jgi:phospholipid transport system substrate-binding protein